MNNLIYELIWFGISFIVIYLFHLLFVVLKNKEYNKKKVPTEARLVIIKYKLDMEKIKYRQLLNFVSLVASFDIAVVVSIVAHFFDNVYFELLFGMLLMIPIILITFDYIGKYYTKKGLVINESKKNRK